MCTVHRLHAMFKQEANKYDTNHYRDFHDAIIDDILYDASLDYVDLFFTGKNYRGYTLGFETNQQRIDMLGNLVQPTTITRESLQTYSDQFEMIFALPQDYYHNSTLTAFDDCGNLINVEIIEHQDLNSSLNYKQQLLWNKAYAVIENNKLVVYFPNTINSIKQVYVKKPNKPFIGGYDTLEFINGDVTYPSQTSSVVHSDVPDTYCRVLIDIAVQNVFNNLRDYNFGSIKEKELINQNF